MCLGVPGRVTALFYDHELLMGRVEFGGIGRDVCLEHVAGVQPGDYVLVHVGYALSRIDEAEAQRTFAFLAELDELDEQKERSS
jgi:hydrogenase expression/formation protein HypC